MTFTRVKRYEGAVFMNTGTLVAPVWSRVAAAIGSFTLALNPKTEEVQDIDMEISEVVLNSFAPSASLTPAVAFGDAVNDDLREICDKQTKNAQKEFLFVDVFDTTTPSTFPARKALFDLIPQQASGGDAGGQLSFAIDVSQNGELTLGTAAVTAGVWAFTAAA